MGEVGRTERVYGVAEIPVDSAPAPLPYTRYAHHGPATPAPYDAPPLPPYDSFTPSHFLPPYDYPPEPAGYVRRPPPAIPPSVRPLGPRWATRPPPPREMEPPFDPPAGMVIPGVQHPDGRFEPHPYFAKRAPPLEEPEEPEEPSKQTVEVAVPVCCEACKERITTYVGQAPGVDSVECDIDEQKVTVIGDVPPAHVLQLCRKCFRKASLV